MIVSWKRPDHLFMEVRAKKLQELSVYKAKSSDSKVKDILKLLTLMKGGKADNAEGASD